MTHPLLARFWVVTATLAWCHPAFPDQCEYFDAVTAKRLESQVKVGDLMVAWCEPCDAGGPLPLRVRSVAIGSDPDLGHTLSINDEQRDLAYLYRSAGDDRFVNLGIEANCADGVSPGIRYVLPARDPARAAPPSPHVVEITDQCYDGSCMLDQWITTRVVTLHVDRNLTSGTAAELPRGASLQVLKVVSELTPLRANVVFDHGRFLAGDEMYLLNSLGEGFQRVWHYGEVVEEDMSGLSTFQMRADVDPARCATPSRECWAEVTGNPEEIWWGLVEGQGGVRGWIRAPETVVESVLELQ